MSEQPGKRGCCREIRTAAGFLLVTVAAATALTGLSIAESRGRFGLDEAALAAVIGPAIGAIFCAVAFVAFLRDGIEIDLPLKYYATGVALLVAAIFILTLSR